MRWIRSKGIALFGISLGGLSILVILFMDNLIESAIEKTGTSLVRARVDLREADLSFFPLGLRLSSLQVTDPDNPMTNAVEIEEIQLSLDTWNLLRRKVIVEEMALEGLRFKTPRRKSGEIRKISDGKPEVGKGEKAEKSAGTFMPNINFPDPGSLLEKEPLPSLGLVRSARADLKDSRESWNKRLKDLPDKETWDAYRKKIQSVRGETGGGLQGLLGGAGNAAALHKEISTEINGLKEARSAFKTDLGTLREKAEKAVKAPFEDIKNIKNKYGLNPEGLSNLSLALFGKQIGKWTETTLQWYARLSPILADSRGKPGGEKQERPPRHKGINVHFDEKEPLPAFLVRSARLSAELPFGRLAGGLKNLTTGPAILGKPATFDLVGENLSDLQSISIKGRLDHVDPRAPKDTVNLKIRGLGLGEKPLSEAEFLPAIFKKGFLDLEGSGQFSGGTLKGVFEAAAKGVRIETPLEKDSTAVQRALASSLAEIAGFNLKTTVSGSPEDYSLRITSDLDRVLKNAVGAVIQKEADRFESKLKAAVLEKTNGEIAGLRSDMAGLESIDKELASRINLGDGLLSELAKSGIKGLKLPFGK